MMPGSVSEEVPSSVRSPAAGTSCESDGSVAVVKDTEAYLYSMHISKGKDARWVRGLSPEDELNEFITEQERKERTLRDAIAKQQIAEQEAMSHRPGAWLLIPNILGVVYLVFLFYRSTSLTHLLRVFRRDFPATEDLLWPHARRDAEKKLAFAYRVAFPLVFPSLIAAMYGILLAFRIGSVSHHFAALCGVGTSVLSVFASCAQVLLLWWGCGLSSISNHWECDIPFVLYWMCSLIRIAGPLLSVLCVTPVLDIVRKTSFMWRFIASIPLGLLAVFVGVMVIREAPAYELMTATHFSIMGVWTLFVMSCWTQLEFHVVVRHEKLHTD